MGVMGNIYNRRRSREGSRMRRRLVNSCEPVPWFRVGLVLILTFALSGWTCSAVSCFGVSTIPQIVSLSPNSMSANATPVLLIVIGDNFIPESQILWNGHALATTFMDSQHLQASISQQTFTQFGGSQGDNVQIAVNTPATRCPISGSSAALVLVIN
jgi:hypothetical protein